LQHIVTAAQEASTAATEIEGEEFNPGLDKGGSFALLAFGYLAVCY